MEKVLEKSIKRYVLGAIEGDKCYYLRVTHRKVPGQFVADSQYELVQDIEAATKAERKSIIRAIQETYVAAIGDSALEFVILPLVIDYSLIKEVNDEAE